MEWLLIVVHVIVCMILIMVVLLQSGKSADLAGAFGGGGSQTALGSRGAATILTKATTVAAILFMLTSLGLALLASRDGGSVLDSAAVETGGGAPAPEAGDAPAPEGGTGTPAGSETSHGTAPAAQGDQ